MPIALQAFLAAWWSPCERFRWRGWVDAIALEFTNQLIDKWAFSRYA